MKQPNQARFKKIVYENKELEKLKEQIKKRSVSKENLLIMLEDIETYFEKSALPSLMLYSGKYSPLINLLFEYYPDYFSEERYRRLTRETLKKSVTTMYREVMAKVELGEIKASQMIDFIKYAEKFITDGKDGQNTPKLVFSLQTEVK